MKASKTRGTQPERQMEMNVVPQPTVPAEPMRYYTGRHEVTKEVFERLIRACFKQPQKPVV